MKKLISIIVSVMLFVSLFAGLQVSAAIDDTYVYVMSETTLGGKNSVNATPNDGYLSCITTGGDPWISINVDNVPPEYEVIAIKYALSSATAPANNSHYIATDGGLNWGQAGSFTGPGFVNDDQWHLKTYSVPSSFTGVGSNNITSFRVITAKDNGKEIRFAYIGFFKSVADAEAYDAEYCSKYTLETIPLPKRELVTPNSIDIGNHPYYNNPFTLDGVAEGTNLHTSGSPFRNNFTPQPSAPWTNGLGSITLVDGAAKFTGFVSAFSDHRWTGANVVSVDLAGLDANGNFTGIWVKYGKEGSNPFYEEDKTGAFTTGTTGIGMSFRKDNKIEIHVKYIDESGALKATTYSCSPVEDIKAVNNYKIADNGEGLIAFYANDKLFAYVIATDAEMPLVEEYGNVALQYSEAYYKNAKVYDAEGKLQNEVKNALISTQCAFAMGTRTSTLSFDNFQVNDITTVELPDLNAGNEGGNEDDNIDTGDFGLIALAFVAISSVVVKKRKEN
ncbi:MAG: hypothetical protein IKJ75_06485 [Clostridia bacterium]|nr:hypothetical protein [Clostridia bacterium]